MGGSYNAGYIDGRRAFREEVGVLEREVATLRQLTELTKQLRTIFGWAKHIVDTDVCPLCRGQCRESEEACDHCAQELVTRARALLADPLEVP